MKLNAKIQILKALNIMSMHFQTIINYKSSESVTCTHIFETKQIFRQHSHMGPVLSLGWV